MQKIHIFATPGSVAFGLSELRGILEAAFFTETTLQGQAPSWVDIPVTICREPRDPTPVTLHPTDPPRLFVVRDPDMTWVERPHPGQLRAAHLTLIGAVCAHIDRSTPLAGLPGDAGGLALDLAETGPPGAGTRHTLRVESDGLVSLSFTGQVQGFSNAQQVFADTPYAKAVFMHAKQDTMAGNRAMARIARTAMYSRGLEAAGLTPSSSQDIAQVHYHPALFDLSAHDESMRDRIDRAYRALSEKGDAGSGGRESYIH